MTTLLVIAIAVLAVALVAAGAWLAWDTRQTQRNEPTDDELVGWVDEISGETTGLEER